MDPLVKQLLNSLRCPLCREQIDIYPRGGYDYSCVCCREHYRISLPNEIPHAIKRETVVVYEGRYRYVIDQLRIPQDTTTITVYSVDPEFCIIDKIPPKQSQLDQRLFDFANTNREKIINKVKILLTFQ